MKKVERRAADQTTIIRRYYAHGEERLNEDDAGKYFCTKDHLGSVRELVDENQTIRTQYAYSPWGKQQQIAGDLICDQGYTGHYHHQQSSLYLAPYRAYDPNNARWINRDPIKENGGINVYGYVYNSVVRSYDLLGLSPDGKGDNRKKEKYLNDPDRKPPGWTPKWPNGLDDRGGYSEDPETGRRYYPHEEDKDHWDHYDYYDENGKRKRYPKDANGKPQKKGKGKTWSPNDPWPSPRKRPEDDCTPVVPSYPRWPFPFPFCILPPEFLWNPYYHQDSCPYG